MLLLQDVDPNVVRAAAWALGGAGDQAAVATSDLSSLLKSPDAQVRHAAALALADLGPVARAAKEAMVTSLWEGGGAIEVHFLATLGEASTPELVRSLDRPDRIAVEFALIAPAQFRAGPLEFAEPLAAAYRRSQYEAARLLLDTGPFGEQVFREVLAGDYLHDLRGVSAHSLRYFDPPAESTLQALRDIAQASDTRSSLRQMAVETLECLGRSPSP